MRSTSKFRGTMKAMSSYNPDFFKPTRPSEKLLHHAGKLLDDIDPKLKDELYQEFGSSQDTASPNFNDYFPLGE